MWQRSLCLRCRPRECACMPLSDVSESRGWALRRYLPCSQVRVTRGAISWFRSSDLARRGFCSQCGTPMIFDYPEYPDIGVLVGSFDEPAKVPPVVQYGIESRGPWFAHLPELPGDKLTYSNDPKGYLVRIKASNRQHPDHDTTVWNERLDRTK